MNDGQVHTIGSCDIFNCEEHRRMCRECDLTVTAGGVEVISLLA